MIRVSRSTISLGPLSPKRSFARRMIRYPPPSWRQSTRQNSRSRPRRNRDSSLARASPSGVSSGRGSAVSSRLVWACGRPTSSKGCSPERSRSGSSGWCSASCSWSASSALRRARFSRSLARRGLRKCMSLSPRRVRPTIAPPRAAWSASWSRFIATGLKRRERERKSRKRRAGSSTGATSSTSLSARFCVPSTTRRKVRSPPPPSACRS